MLARGRGLHLGKGEGCWGSSGDRTTRTGQAGGRGRLWTRSPAKGRGRVRFQVQEGKVNEWAVVGSRSETGVRMTLPGVGDGGHSEMG